MSRCGALDQFAAAIEQQCEGRSDLDVPDEATGHMRLQ